MGSGKRPVNIKIPASPLAGGGKIKCEERGKAAALVLSAGHEDSIGSLRLRADRVVLVVGDTEVAEIKRASRLRECLRAGFEYEGILEEDNGSPTIRYRLR